MNKTLYLSILSVVLLSSLFGASTFELPWTVLDSPTFTIVARTILEGGAPYKDVWDVKGPGIHFAYALADVLFGSSARGLRIFEMFWQMLTALVLFWIGRRISNDLRAGALTGVLYLLVYYASEYWALAQPDGLVTLPLALAFTCILHAEGKSGWRLWYLASVFIGVAAGFKLPLGLAGLFVMRAAFLPHGWKSFWPRVVPMITGLGTPLTLMLLFVNSRGALNDFLLSQFTVAPHYAAMWRSSITAQCLLENLARISVLPELVLFVFVIVLMVLHREIWKEHHWVRHGLFLWLGVALFVLVLHGSFQPYHMLPLLGPVAILGAIVFRWLAIHFRQTFFLERFMAAITLFVLAAVPSFRVVRNFQLAREIGPPNDTQTYWYQLGSYLRDHTTPQDQICIWGNTPIVYLHAERKSATRFIYMIFLARDFPGANLKEVFLSEFHRTRPKFFVLLKPQPPLPCSAATRSDGFPAFESFNEFRRIVDRDYVLEREDEMSWIYRRKDAPASPAAGEPSSATFHSTSAWPISCCAH